MAQYELLLPKMGESVAEATIIKWIKQPGDQISLDDTILEIATDKVDSEVPSPVEGKLVKQLFAADEVVQVGAVIAIIEIAGEVATIDTPIKEIEPALENVQVESIPGISQLPIESKVEAADLEVKGSDRFYSPLVKNIAKEENISFSELDQIQGTGSEGRLTKDDLLNYISTRENKGKVTNSNEPVVETYNPQPI
ncbi:biotin/lipoyl-containing protein, partial [Pedobacter sp. ASV28]|uniref:biotin/lipoyl-containing protein n=1 Tax=Pedobacter sp. ASV28 TaxID=2795123 RepID=UPI0018ECA2F6